MDKKAQSDNFDVSLGSYDDKFLCELVGIYIINKLATVIKNEDADL